VKSLNVGLTRVDVFSVQQHLSNRIRPHAGSGYGEKLAVRTFNYV